MDENIAEVIFDPEAKRIVRMTFYRDDLRFRCIRCAVFCCKLGGPILTKSDMERAKLAGHWLEDSLETTADPKFKRLPMTVGNLKNNKAGSCIFLKSSPRRGVYECPIYDSRPARCRLYPFDFETISPNSFTLKLIPCCNGLNAEDGELVNENFITKHLLNALLDLFV
ncbi:MAG: YkgJ family cysteine cluster protein [Candidatus Bathyarchaeia archaeon]